MSGNPSPQNGQHPVDRIKNSPIIWIAGTIAGVILFIITVMSALGLELVRKDSYILTKDLDGQYVKKADYDVLVTREKVQKDDPQSLADPSSFRKVKIFENDSVDYYGIMICTGESCDKFLMDTRKKLKNNGFPNTEVFVTNENRYCVIVYGYASMGTRIKKNLNSIKRMIPESKEISCVDLTTLATEGFIEFRENDVFRYFIPRGTKRRRSGKAS